METAVGAAIRFARQRRRLSARQLSEAAGLSPSYVSKVESGEIEPKLTTFGKIAVELEMSPEEICFCVLSAVNETVTPGQ